MTGGAGDDIVILGAGRHGRVVLDVMGALGFPVAGFLDDTKQPGELVDGAPVLGPFARCHEPSLRRTARFIVAVGDSRARLVLGSAIRAAGGRVASAVHPACSVSPSARLGAGVYLGAFSRVLPNASVADFCLVEGLSTVGTDSTLGEGAFLGPGCHLTGGASVGELAFLGAGTVVIGPARVGARSVVGAGAVVRRDIPEGSFAAGVPAVVKGRAGGEPWKGCGSPSK